MIDDHDLKEGKAAVQGLVTDIATLREDLVKLSTSVRDLVQAQAASTTKRMVGAVDDARAKIDGRNGRRPRPVPIASGFGDGRS